MSSAKFQTLMEPMVYALLCLNAECHGMNFLDRVPTRTNGRVTVASGMLNMLLE